MLTGQSSHEVVNGRQKVLLLDAQHGQLIVSLALKGKHSLRSVVETPTILDHLLVSWQLLLLCGQLGLIPGDVPHVKEELGTDSPRRIGVDQVGLQGSGLLEYLTE